MNVRQLLTVALVLAFATPADAGLCRRKQRHRQTQAGYGCASTSGYGYQQAAAIYYPTQPQQVVTTPDPGMVPPTPIPSLPTDSKPSTPTPPIPTAGQLNGTNPNQPNSPEWHWWEFWKQKQQQRQQ